MITPIGPKGMRDFYADEVYQRRELFKIIEDAFESYGFAPLETPSLENLTTLTQKYGEEGDRLIFKVLKSGDFLNKANQEDLTQKNSSKISASIADKGLRYDLTVPFARFVAQNHSSLAFPFRRYQIQQVWRAERPQRGRYREFTQCDGDIIGDQSLACEFELIQIYHQVFSKLGLKNFRIRFNHRKLLGALATGLGIGDQMIDMTVAIDKLDKIGVDKVIEELRKKNINKEACDQLHQILQTPASERSLSYLKSFLADNDDASTAIREIEMLCQLAQEMSIDSLVFDPMLARGLDYYTGSIFEVDIPSSQIGGLGGGGRYDHLTDIFGVKNLSGVGISFGADRILLSLEEQGLLSTQRDKKKILLTHFNDQLTETHLKLATRLRAEGLKVEFYPSAAKMKKQFKFANQKQIPWVITQGEQELENNLIALKNLETGEQKTLTLEQLLEHFRSL